MKVVTTYTCDEDFYEHYELEVDGKTVVSVGTPEPEDCSLSRDLSFAFSIPKLMRKAYEAGKRGEEFTIEEGDGK